MINLNDAIEIGFTNSTEILIAINAEPQIALNIINNVRLFVKKFFIKNYLLFLGCGISIVS